jgi:hypothetical protein
VRFDSSVEEPVEGERAFCFDWIGLDSTYSTGAANLVAGRST